MIGYLVLPQFDPKKKVSSPSNKPTPLWTTGNDRRDGCCDGVGHGFGGSGSVRGCGGGGDGFHVATF